MKANFGLLPTTAEIKALRGRRERAIAHYERALRTLDEYLASREVAKGLTMHARRVVFVLIGLTIVAGIALFGFKRISCP